MPNRQPAERVVEKAFTRLNIRKNLDLGLPTAESYTFTGAELEHGLHLVFCISSKSKPTLRRPKLAYPSPILQRWTTMKRLLKENATRIGYAKPARLTAGNSGDDQTHLPENVCPHVRCTTCQTRNISRGWPRR